MIYINYLNKEKLKKDISFVITDFDRTITYYNSPTTWSLFSKSNLVNPLFKKETDKLYEYYRKIEINNELSFDTKSFYMQEWAIKQLCLFKKSGIDEQLFYKIIDSSDKFKLRADFIPFVKRLNELGIKIYIVSGGIYDVIKYVLEKNNILLDNITIVSNHINFDNRTVNISGNIIHSFNKGDITLPIKQSELGLLFGDLVSDKEIGKKYNTIDVVFSPNGNTIENKNNFDITLTGGSSFSNVGKIFIKKYEKRC